MMAKRAFDSINEQSVLAAALLDVDARRKVCASVKPDHFIGPKHREIFRSILACDENDVLDPEIILLKSKDKKVLGGRGYLTHLFTMDPPSNPIVHIRALLEASTRSVATVDMKTLEDVLTDPTVPYNECVQLVGALYSKMTNLGMDQDTGKALAAEYLSQIRSRRDGLLLFRPTGFGPLDEIMTEGLASGRITVVAGRPGHGKSTLVTNMIRYLLKSEDKPRILVLPVEPGKYGFMDQLVSLSTGIPYLRMVKEAEELTNAEMQDIEKKTNRLLGDDRLTVKDNPFYELDDWTNDSAMDKLEELFATGGYDIIVVDLWDRILPEADKPGPVSKALRRQQHIVKKYGGHLIAVHQISRKVEERKDKRPTMADLKGSGAWEEVANVVLGVYRDRMYKPMLTRDVMEVEVIKQKTGPPGLMEVDFDGTCFSLRNARHADARSKRKREKLVEDDDDAEG